VTVIMLRIAPSGLSTGPDHEDDLGHPVDVAQVILEADDPWKVEKLPGRRGV
jgi:hypothetical protein